MSARWYPTGVLMCLALGGAYARQLAAPGRSLLTVQCVTKADVVQGVDVLKSACQHYEGATFVSQQSLAFNSAITDLNSASAVCDDDNKKRDDFIADIYKSHVHKDVKDGTREYSGQAKSSNEAVTLPVFTGYMTTVAGWPSKERCAAVSPAGRLAFSMASLGAVLVAFSLAHTSGQ